MSKVYLIGAGPGDPELITIKGRRILEQADVVFYDRLAPAALLDLAPPHAERIYAGKRKSAHAFTQEEVCAMLIERARRGLTVVRLKGGAPFIFGRGGEEAEALAAAGIPFEIVPGGHAARHRRLHRRAAHASRAHFRRQLRDRACRRRHRLEQGGAGGDAGDLYGPHHVSRDRARTDGPRPFPRNARHGRPLGHAPLPGDANRHARYPAGPHCRARHEAAGHHHRGRDKLNWYERLPLFGKRIVVTRAKGQADALSARLGALGAAAIEIPTIEIRPAADCGPLDRAIANLSSYDWLIFTSANGVRFFLDRLDRSATDLRALRGRICAIGPATRAAIEALHLKVDLMGKEYVAEGLLEAFTPYDPAGKVVLLPRAAVARDLVPAELARRGAHVDVVEAYRTVVPDEAARQAREVFDAAPKPDCITFTSSSTVENFVAAAGAETLAGVPVVSIGPVTTRTARRLGIEVAAEARVFTDAGLVEAVLGLYTGMTPPTTE